jgi:serine/threonine protein phosphatase PrpC
MAEQYGDGIDGCVALVAVLRGDTLIIANIGDCRAIKLHQSNMKNVDYTQLSTDHIPENPFEDQNIRDKGGLILRINKSLRVNG